MEYTVHVSVGRDSDCDGGGSHSSLEKPGQAQGLVVFRSGRASSETDEAKHGNHHRHFTTLALGHRCPDKWPSDIAQEEQCRRRKVCNFF